MSATFNWEILKIECYPTLEGRSDVVATVYWKCTATENINGVDYSFSVKRNTKLRVPKQQDTFIPYANLTQTQVQQWVWDTKPILLDNSTVKELTEAELQQTLTSQISPTTIVTMPPWVSTTTPVEYIPPPEMWPQPPQQSTPDDPQGETNE